MEKNKKISNIYIYLLMIYYNLNYASICFSSFIMKDFSKISWMIPILCIVPLIILVFLYNPKNNVKNLKNKTFFKILLLINSVFHNIVLIYISSQMMGISFYHLTPVSLFAIASIILTCFLSFFSIKKIFRLGIILITGLIWFVPFIFDFEFNNQPNMDLLGKLDLSLFKAVYFTTVTNDLFLYSLYNNDYKKKISRKGLILAGSLILITAALQIVDSFTLVNYRYYEGLEMPSLNRYFSHQGKRFFEHFDILLLFLTLTTCFFKVPFNVILVKDTLEKKYQVKFIIIYFLILLPLVFFLILNFEYLRYVVMSASITSGMITLWIIIYSRWRKRNVSTNNQSIEN